MKLLTIIRGASGSGKSHLARGLRRYNIRESGITSSTICADDFMLDENEEYKFEKDRLPEVHRLCLERVREEMLHETSNIILHNTSTKRWEYAVYLNLARELGYDVQVVDVYGYLDNVHNTPDEVLKRQRDRFEPHRYNS